MSKIQRLLPLLFVPASVWAVDSDSIKVNNKENRLVSNTEVVANEVPSAAVEVANYSYDIVDFDADQLPVTEALFNEHVSSLEFEIPMNYNPQVKAQIDFFATRWQKKLKEVVSRSEYYFPIYEEILDKHDMPLELKYLSIIESGLNPYAHSRAGAVGPWQFMPATGRIFDLDVNYRIDERRSIEKSTNAACSYLRQMYDMFGDWQVALASYNCGPGNVRKAIRYSGRTDFWGMYPYLPRETRNYVPKFIAMAYIMNYYEHYGITPAPINDYEYCIDQVYCKEGMEFEAIAEQLGLTVEELMRFNPELKVPHIPKTTGGYRLTIPADKTTYFYDHEEQIFALSNTILEEKAIAEANRPQEVIHVVRKGECLPIIARKYGCTVTQLKSWNNIHGSVIHPNQKLKIIRT